MASFLDFDPLTGVQQWVDGDESNRLQVHYRQDVEPLLDLTKLERSEGASDLRWRKTGMALYARIPPVVVLEILHKYGVDIMSANKTHWAKAFKIINSDYPHLKCTDMHHSMSSYD